MKLTKRFALLLLLIVAVSTQQSCRKKSDPVSPVPGNLKMEFTNQVDGILLSLNATQYVNAHGDSFRVSTLKYYISNIRVTTADGQTYTEPESYHLVDAADPDSRKIVLSQVPAGEYTRISFLIGVDSLRNVSGAQTGALDPSHGMFWTWNSGYIMAKMEGTSPQSGDPTKLLLLHIGGYSGPNQVQRHVNLNLPGGAAVSVLKTPNIHLFANLGEWFKAPTVIDFSQVYTVMSGGLTAKSIADNYADMFTVDHVD